MHRPRTVIAKRFEDLIAWQLAYRLQQDVFAFTATPRVARDVKYCDQIRESSRSTSRNIAEGFGRFYPKEFRRFLQIAAGSLHETKAHLLEGHDRGYLADDEYDRLSRLAFRAIKATSRLSHYLSTAVAPAR